MTRVEWLDPERPCDAGDCPGEECPVYWECKMQCRVEPCDDACRQCPESGPRPVCLEE
jgi:hypothetical protein